MVMSFAETAAKEGFAKYIGLSVQLPKEWNRLVWIAGYFVGRHREPLAVEMPCGKVYIYNERTLPTVDTACGCGSDKEIVVQWTEK